MAGGHVVVIAATDARIKAVVADAPIIEGKDTPRKASSPTGAMLKAEQKRARTNGEVGPAEFLENDIETRLALGEYHPFWYLDQVPKTTPVLFVTKATDVKSSESAEAASKRLTGPTDVVRIPAGINLSSNAVEAASKAAVDWFLKHL
jgi:hypothetical protein